MRVGKMGRWKIALVAGVVGASVAVGIVVAATTSASTGLAVNAYCNGHAVEVVYTVPPIGGLTVYPTYDGRSLTPWVEPPGGRTVPVVIGVVPPGTFAVTVGGRTASVELPLC